MTGGYTADGEAFTAAYDAENRLVSLASVSHSASFTYAHDGFLSKQVVDGVETRFVRGTGFLCLQERNASNGVTKSYVWNPTAPGGIGGLLEMTEGADHYSYLYDGKGNVKSLIDGSQNVVATYSYDEFGNLVSETSTIEQPYKFSTKRYYDGLGLNYYGYRFYSASLGRWMTRDPIGEEGGLNLYGFVNNGPITYIDPLGLMLICTYSQSTGNFVCYDNCTMERVIDTFAYSGNGEGYNDPLMEHTRNVGPIPRGEWKMLKAIKHEILGEVSIPLKPISGEPPFGRQNYALIFHRDKFYIPGDNKFGNGTASKGCIVLGRKYRVIIDKHGGGTLYVN